MAGKSDVVEKQLLSVAQAIETTLDEQIDKLDRLDTDDLEQLRERRLQQLKKQAATRNEWISNGHGELTELDSEKEFFRIVKLSDRVVCHFFRDNNWPCQVADNHLIKLSKQHLETKFVKVNAEKSPFLAERLKIFMLPTIALIKKAKIDDYIVGFDEFGGKDDFSTEDLERRLIRGGVLFEDGEGFKAQAQAQAQSTSIRRMRQGNKKGDNSDSDSDENE